MDEDLDKKQYRILETELITMNLDVLRTKEEQLQELSNDNQHQSQKTQQLIWFFWAVSAIIFSQDGLGKVPLWVLWMIFMTIIVFLLICMLSLKWRSITSMLNVDFIREWRQIIYLEQKIKELQKCQDNLRWVIEHRNFLNNIALVIFGILLLVYAFIFLIYNNAWY